jgi:hypothetical protein
MTKSDGSKNASTASTRKFKITGVLAKRATKKTKKGGNSDEGVVPKGYLNCGCPEDIALLDFYFWKTWKVKQGDDEEGLRNQRIDPRLRLFFAEFFTKETTLTVDDLYTKGRTAVEAHKIQLRLKIHRLSKQLKALERPDEDTSMLS